MQDLPILESLGGSAEQAQYWTAKAMPDGQWVATRRVSNLDHGAKESVQDPVESGRIPPRSVSDDSVVSQGVSAAHVVSASLLVTGATPAQSDPANCLARPDAPCSPRGSGFSGLALKLPMSIARPLTLAAENRMSESGPVHLPADLSSARAVSFSVSPDASELALLYAPPSRVSALRSPRGSVVDNNRNHKDSYFRLFKSKCLQHSFETVRGRFAYLKSVPALLTVLACSCML